MRLRYLLLTFFFFNDTATTEIYTLSLHDALPIYHRHGASRGAPHRSPAARPLRPPGRPGPERVLPVARGRPDAAVRLRPHRPLDGSHRRRGGRGHHASVGDERDRPGAEAGRAAELPGPQEAARVRRRDEPAARGDLLAAAVRAPGRRGARGPGAAHGGAGGRAAPRRPDPRRPGRAPAGPRPDGDRGSPEGPDLRAPPHP